MDYNCNIHPSGENVNSLELQARNVGNSIAYGMMHKPDPQDINHKGHDCIIVSMPLTCE